MDYEDAKSRAAGNGELVWHYTSLDTLKLILESNALLSTEVSFQNDISETSTADVAIAEVLKAFAEDSSVRAFSENAQRVYQDIDDGMLGGFDEESRILNASRFIVCASREPDSLYAWRTYGGAGIGCAIGLDPSVPLGAVGSLPGRDLQTDGWLPVMYQEAEYRGLAEDELRALATRWNASRKATDYETFVTSNLNIDYEELPRIRAQVRARAKQAAFADEHEYRFTLSGGTTPSMLTFTPSSMGPRPHVRVAVADDWGRGIADPSKAEKLPIRAVRLGPSAPPIAEESLQWLLIANGYSIDAQPAGWDESGPYGSDWSSSVVIAKSAHPYRTT